MTSSLIHAKKHDQPTRMTTSPAQGDLPIPALCGAERGEGFRLASHPGAVTCRACKARTLLADAIYAHTSTLMFGDPEQRDEAMTFVLAIADGLAEAGAAVEHERVIARLADRWPGTSRQAIEDLIGGGA